MEIWHPIKAVIGMHIFIDLQGREEESERMYLMFNFEYGKLLVVSASIYPYLFEFAFDCMNGSSTVVIASNIHCYFVA